MLLQEHGSVTSLAFKEIITDRPTDQTDMRVHGEVELPTTDGQEVILKTKLMFMLSYILFLHKGKDVYIICYFIFVTHCKEIMFKD